LKDGLQPCPGGIFLQLMSVNNIALTFNRR
jgi:hypothetical protein